MKNILLLAALTLFITTQVSAQDVVDKVAEGTCSCMKGLDPKIKGDELETKLGLCIIQQATIYEKDIKKQYHIGVDELSTKQGQKFAEQVGVKMVSKCPDEMMKVVAASSASETATDATAASGSVQGTVADIQTAQFVTIVIKDESGRDQKLLWLDYFEGSDLLKKGLSSVKGKSFKVSYTERELYNPSLQEYIKYKVISKLEAK